MANHSLIITNAIRRGQELPARPGLALDESHFVYEDFGLVTFHYSVEGTVSSVEWWNEIFTRIEE